MSRRGFGDWEKAQYKLNFRITKEASWMRHSSQVEVSLRKQDTRSRRAVPSCKSLGITLHWFAHGLSFSQVAILYGVGKTTAAKMIHSVVDVFKIGLAQLTIAFPQGVELERFKTNFNSFCGFSRSSGANDGTFMEIEKPPL